MTPPDITFVSTDKTQDYDAGSLSDLAASAATLFKMRISGERVGVIFRTEPALIVTWLGLVSAGFVPLMLEYPTQRQNRAVWKRSIETSRALADLDTVICAPDVALLLDDVIAFELADLDEVTAAGEPFTVRSPAFLQLSSGTTGHRKAIAFTPAQVEEHLHAYNGVMQVGPADTCVSWLPLYHDMGFVACFLLSMTFGARLVLIDPMDWVREPGLLMDAIAAHRATYCYMPNFGFEVMARSRTADLSSMRRWVSCSEPIYAETVERFCAAHAVAADKFSCCYAMAENVFAVTQCDGIAVVERDGVSHLSCGRPIPGVSIDVRDGEIHVGSATALRGYEGGVTVTDDRGMFATGDIGFLHEGELVVTGRSGDILNVAGRKYMLNDLDFEVNRIAPDVRGRSAALGIRNSALGTEQLVVLVEREEFFRTDPAPLTAELIANTGIEGLAVHFVPPGFITKTSSGKINRKRTAADWLASAAVRADSISDDMQPLSAVIRDVLPKLPTDVPVTHVVDSLGLAIVRMLVEERKLPFNDDLTLDDLDRLEAEARNEHSEVELQVRVVNLGEPTAFRALSPNFLESLSETMGVRIVYEQFCAPPAKALLNDIVFHDYFMARDPRGLAPYERFMQVVRALKNASLVIVDDFAEYFRAARQPVPTLNHKLQRSELAGRLGWRHQRYTAGHHELPIQVLASADMVTGVEQAIDDLGAYLSLPIFRVAFQETAHRPTAGWDHVLGTFAADSDFNPDLDAGDAALHASFTAFLEKNWSALVRPGTRSTASHSTEGLHFCSALMRPDRLKQMVDLHDNFLIYGPKSSVLELQEEITRQGKTYVQTLDWYRDAQPYLDSFDCIIQTGTWSKPYAAQPIYQVFWAGYGELGNELQPVWDWFYDH